VSGQDELREPEADAIAGEVWQEADNVLLLCVIPNRVWQDFNGQRFPWDAPTVARPLRRLLDRAGNLVAEHPATPAEVRCDTCADTGRMPWMSEGDPNFYQESDDDGMLPCIDCTPPAEPGAELDSDDLAPVERVRGRRVPDDEPEPDAGDAELGAVRMAVLGALITTEWAADAAKIRAKVMPVFYEALADRECKAAEQAGERIAQAIFDCRDMHWQDRARAAAIARADREAGR